jgi:hypothetical protein
MFLVEAPGELAHAWPNGRTSAISGSGQKLVLSESVNVRRFGNW